MFILLALISWIILLLASIIAFFLIWMNFTINIVFKTSEGGSGFINNFLNSNFYKLINNNIYGKTTNFYNFFYGNYQDNGSLNAFQLYIFPVISLFAIGIIVFYCIDEFYRIHKKQVISRYYFKPFLLIFIIFNIVMGKSDCLMIAMSFVLGLCLQELLFLDRNLLQNFAEEKGLINILKDRKKYKKEGNKNNKKTNQKKKDNTLPIKETTKNINNKKDLDDERKLEPKIDQEMFEKIHTVLENRLKEIESKINEIKFNLELINSNKGDAKNKNSLMRELNKLKYEKSKWKLINKKTNTPEKLKEQLNVYNSSVDISSLIPELNSNKNLNESKTRKTISKQKVQDEHPLIKTEFNKTKIRRPFNYKFSKSRIFIEFERGYQGIKFNFKNQKNFYIKKLKYNIKIKKLGKSIMKNKKRILKSN